MIQGHYIEGQDVDLSGVTQTVTPCDDGSYCCGNGTRADACCKEKKGLFVIDGKAVSLDPDTASKTASTSSNRAKPSSSSTASLSLSEPVGAPAVTAQSSPTGLQSSSTSPASSAAKSSDKTGAIVGGIIGGIAVLVLIVGITLILKRRPHVNLGHQSLWTTSKGEKRHGSYEVSGNDGSNELDTAAPLQELDHSRARYEMQ